MSRIFRLLLAKHVTYCKKSFHTTTNMAGVPTAAALYATVTQLSSTSQAAAVPEDTKELKHHLKHSQGFANPWPSYREQSAPQIIRSMLWKRITGDFKTPDTKPPTVTVHKPSFLPSRETKSLRATWLGHACYYVEFPGGFRVLFDPVFTPRCSPFSFMGPKRFTEQPCKIEDIPIIDAVVISHNHYDHLSYPTILEIKKHHPNAHFFAGLGNKKWFKDVCGIDNMTELDWWESRYINLRSTTTSTSEVKPLDAETPSDVSAVIECLPSQHQSARGLSDRNHTLWASWRISSGGKNLWFAGDTGYRSVNDVPAGSDDYDPPERFPHCPAFKSIGSLRGPFDLGLIPIGAYSPRDIMSPFHANPMDAANIFVDTNCNRALAMHWGTWVLTDEEVMEPPKKLKEALKTKGISEEGTFDICDIGESREF